MLVLNDIPGIIHESLLSGFGLTINMEGLSLETADIRFMCLFFLTIVLAKKGLSSGLHKTR
ncbi:TPA: hypothetical protein JBB15_07105 [Legionella pneumophila subsp. pneumophila]|nr:hypothetical protein [Legionella pneumophila subsp. pneumophila]HAU0780556.1 hypothetical protein [Legionella pneumophila]HAU1690541.1 hypothetical protein [Legionella pneumophila]